MYGIKLTDMEDGTGHPYLAQIPLTVSPFVSLPAATTLPYTYKTLPNALPPAATSDTDAKFVVSASGHAAHPDDIAASCRTLEAHIARSQKDAEDTYTAWADAIAARTLAEKRRVAPGWLDGDQKLLEPTKASENVLDAQTGTNPSTPSLTQQRDAAGAALDRAFGGLSTR